MRRKGRANRTSIPVKLTNCKRRWDSASSTNMPKILASLRMPEDQSLEHDPRVHSVVWTDVSMGHES